MRHAALHLLALSLLLLPLALPAAPAAVPAPPPPAPAAGQDHLVRRDGTTLAAPGVEFAAGQFHGGGLPAPLDRQAVQDWWLQPKANGGAGPAAAAAPQAEAQRAQMREWLAAARQAAARNPGCKGIQVLDWGVSRLTPDHREVYHYRFAGLILDDDLLRWGTLQLGFSEGRSRIRRLEARCLTADGRLLELDPAAVRASRPQSGGGEFFDPNARQLTATIPGAEVGALVAYEIEYETYALEDWRLFSGSFQFQSTEVPLLLSRFDVLVPEGVKLHWWETPEDDRPFWRRWLSRGGRPCPERLDETAPDGSRLQGWRWERRAVPLLVPEPAMPPEAEIAPAVHVTLHRDWHWLDSFIGGLQAERLRPTPELEQLARTITGGATTADEKAARLYHWVQKKIRYISIKSSLSSGWTGHPAAETLKNGYGDCTDKSILLATLLRCAGIAAEPAVLRTNDAGLFTPRFPMLRCNHAITVAHLAGQHRYLDSTAQDYRYPAFRPDDHGVAAFNFIRGEHGPIPLPPGREAAAKETVEEFSLQPDLALRARLANRYAGGWEAGIRGAWKEIPAELQRQVMQQSISRAAPGARLESLTLGDPQDLDRPFTLEFAWTAPAYLQKAGPLRVFIVPERERSFPEFSLETRRHPIAWTTTELQTRKITIRLPPGWSCPGRLPDLDLGNRHFRYRERWRYAPGQIELGVEFERFSQRLPPADYPATRRLAQQIEEATRRPLILRPD